MEQPVEQCPEKEELVSCDPCTDNEGTSIDALPTDGSEVDPPPDEVSENEPEEAEQLQQTPVVGTPNTDPDKTAPLAEQERDSGLHVPPPSPNNGNTDNDDDECKIIVTDNDAEIPDVPTPEKEDAVFIEQEVVPQSQPTPKKNEEQDKKEKKEKKEKEKKEKKEKKDKKDKKKKKEETEEELLTDTLPKERKPRKFNPGWTIPPVYK